MSGHSATAPAIEMVTIYMIDLVPKDQPGMTYIELHQTVETAKNSLISHRNRKVSQKRQDLLAPDLNQTAVPITTALIPTNGDIFRLLHDRENENFTHPQIPLRFDRREPENPVQRAAHKEFLSLDLLNSRTSLTITIPPMRQSHGPILPDRAAKAAL